MKVKKHPIKSSKVQQKSVKTLKKDEPSVKAANQTKDQKATSKKGKVPGATN